MPMAKEVIERVEKVQKFAEDELAAIKSNITAMSEQVSLMVAQNEEIKKFKEQFSAFQSSVTKAIDELGDAPQNSEPVRNEFRNEENQQSVEERIAATRAKLFNR
jgi:DNA repair ATPase RecN